ncbi:lantibiotic dehydratase [Sphingobacterium sp. UBA2480]|nr:lantibiotic dehydratase [Sphingobacterium sp. UBA2480]
MAKINANSLIIKLNYLFHMTNQTTLYTTPKQIVLRTPAYSISFIDKFEKLNKNNELFLFKAGVLISSKDLFDKWNKDDNNSNKLLLSLHKYWLRSCTRTTPFATFAGCSILNLAKESNILLETSHENSIKIRLTLNTVEKLVNLLKDEHYKNILEKSKLILNDSFYNTKFSYRYFKLIKQNNKKDYYLTSVKKDKYLNNIVRTLKKGAISFKDLSYLFIEKFPEISLKEAEDYISDLINAQIIVSNFNISITGDDFLAQLLMLIKGNDIILKREIEEELIKINKLCKAPSCDLKFLDKLNESISKLTGSQDIGFIAELFPKTMIGEINSETVETIIKQVEELQDFFYEEQNQNLENFKHLFQVRYGDQKIPLLEVLDPSTGIGYVGSVDQNNSINKHIEMLGGILNEEATFPINELGSISNFILKKYIEFVQSEKNFIEITENDLILRPKKILDKSLFPNFSSMVGSLLKEGRNNFIFNLTGFGGVTGGTNILGRFAYGDEQLRLLLNELTLTEELSNPHCLFAEIVHYPNDQVGNISQRPPLRKYEIPFIAMPSVGINSIIPLQDLLVSIVNNKIILESKTLKKQVVPRLSSAHNFRLNTLPVYQFLGDLQFQNVPISDFWNWGLLQNQSYLPRVMYKNLILSRATWVLNIKEIELISDYQEYLTIVKRKLNIPDIVCIVNGDNELYMDFKSHKCQSILIDYLKKGKNIILKEFLFTAENSLVHDTKGDPYVNELIIPIYKRKPDIITSTISNRKIRKEKYSINSQWLFLKIYGNREPLEDFLSIFIYNFLNKNKNLFEKFFFIRYIDETGFHLRLRFQNAVGYEEKNVKIIQLITNLLEKVEYHRILVDEYAPEFNRYGGELLTSYAESFFHFDSYWTIKFLNHFNKFDGEDNLRMWFAIKSTERYLDDFFKIIKDKYKFVALIRDNFFQEFNIQKKSYNKINRINNFIKINEKGDAKTVINKILDSRSKNIKDIIIELTNKTKKYDNILLYNIIASYIHMSINRIFPNRQRENELIIYNYLERQLHAENSRANKVKYHQI